MNRREERAFLAGAIGLVGAAAALLAATRPGDGPALLAFFLLYAACFLAAHWAIGRLLPGADELLLPLVCLLVGLGLVTLFRLRPATAWRQLAWTALGLAAALGGAGWVRTHQRLARYRYLAGVTGLLLVAATLLFGQTAGGARAWLVLGPFHFEPSEVGKVLLVLFLAGYLDETKEVLSVPGVPSPRLGIRLPNFRYLGPVTLLWAVSMVLLVGQNDLGAALLFFGIFLVMLYVATGRRTYVGMGLLLAALGGLAAYRWVPHVRLRIALWLDPWADLHGRGYQMVTALFSLAAGGLWGTGIGLGHPALIPAVTTDFALAAWAEEWGLVGTAALVTAFLALVARGAQLAVSAPDDYGLLLGAGLTTILAVQGATILGGVTRVIPLTGVTMPFFSYGGTAAVTDLLIMALLGLVSAGRGKGHEPA
ncbi:MAG: FtsW/RodA/SpoVE family cell cycle protein [Bacillota bacterium]|nr:FtsW/RodA/SpoVE family cell cycle protein [Bacillota bacterium]